MTINALLYSKGEPIHLLEKAHFPCLYLYSHSFIFKRINDNDVNKKIRPRLIDLWSFSTSMLHLVGDDCIKFRTQQFTDIGHQTTSSSGTASCAHSYYTVPLCCPRSWVQIKWSAVGVEFVCSSCAWWVLYGYHSHSPKKIHIRLFGN